MRITRNASLTEQQFLGCASAFVDALAGELNAAAMFLRKLEGQPKGAAFAYEMSLDRHRYGALTVLDRWGTLVETFGRHMVLSRRQAIVELAAARVADAGRILGAANDVLDAAEVYTHETVEAGVLAFQSLGSVFAEEREAALQSARLGPLLPGEFHEARAVFAQDLAAR